MAKAMPRFPEFAALLRKFMTDNEINPPKLRNMFGYPKNSTTVYGWINGNNRPPIAERQKLTKMLGIDPHYFDTPRKSKEMVVYKPKVTTTDKRTNVLTYVIHNDGTARIAFDLTLPHDQATPLLRMLLDASIVFQPPNS